MPKPIDTPFRAKEQGERIKYLRGVTRLSRRAFALKHGIPPGTLQNCEDGRYQNLTEKTAKKLVAAFQTEGIECDLRWLLSGEGSPPANRFGFSPPPVTTVSSSLPLQETQLLERTLENEQKRKQNESLYDAVVNGRYQDVIDLIQAGVDVHLSEGVPLKPYENEHNTPLHLAALHGYLDIVKWLIKKGANVNAKNRKEHTALHLAVHNAHKEVIRYLIQQGADINATEHEGDTPLAWAAYKRQIEVVKQLIELGANIHSQNNFGNTPLHWAAEKGYTDIVKLLIDYGANPQVENWKHLMPLMLAVENGHLGTVKFLLKVSH